MPDSSPPTRRPSPPSDAPPGPARPDGGTPAFLTPAQIAARFPVSRSAVYAACRAGLLPHYRVPTRPGARGKVLVKEADLLAWVEGHRRDGPAADEDGSLTYLR